MPLSQVKDDVASRYERKHIGGSHIGHHGTTVTLESALRSFSAAATAFRQSRSDVLLIEGNLALDIIHLDEIPIHQPYETAPRAHKGICDCSAEPSHADHADLPGLAALLLWAHSSIVLPSSSSDNCALGLVELHRRVSAFIRRPVV